MTADEYSEFELEVFARLDAAYLDSMDQATDELVGDVSNWRPTGVLNTRPA